MSKIILMAETGSDISKELAAEYNIHIVPMHVNFDDEKQVNKLYGFLLRRGFKFNEIKDAFTEYRNKKENI